MATILAPNDAVSVTNPALQALVASEGYLVDPFALEFAIYDWTSGSPVEQTARGAVDLVADRLGIGRFVPDWTVPGAATEGRWEIRWYVQLVSGGPWAEWRENFDVVDTVVWTGRTPYALVSDLRAEGFATSVVSTARAQEILIDAADFIERATGRRFVPEYKEFRIDGTGSPMLFLDEPIVAIEDITLLGSDLTPSDPLETDSIRVGNRHLSQNLFRPDDRNNPHIRLYYAPEDSVLRSLVYRGTWPVGTQNVEVSGVFGYTDPNGSPAGGTPRLIRQAALMLAYRELYTLGADDREDIRVRSRIIEERTRDQSYKLSDPGDSLTSRGNITGDPDIDRILNTFRRPPTIRST